MLESSHDRVTEKGKKESRNSKKCQRNQHYTNIVENRQKIAKDQMDDHYFETDYYCRKQFGSRKKALY